ncbi:hypothetical protein O5D80_007642 [Batrachochytrium dendrobatidis]|nr:hypothetical protein O5D80_007642 [Batrachochytrium dendrobatidis]
MTEESTITNAVQMDALEPIATNTLVFTNLALEAFDNQGHALRNELLSKYQHLIKLVILKSFGRMLAIFAETATAVQIKKDLHKTQFLNYELRVYYGQHTDLSQLGLDGKMKQTLLSVPQLERNFLLSPPGSPPVGWEQPKELAPVTGGHTEALSLSTLSLAGFCLDGGVDVDLDNIQPQNVVDTAHFSKLSITSDGRRQETLTFGTGVASAKSSADVSLPVIVIEAPLYSEPDLDSESIPLPRTPLPRTSRPHHSGC